MFFDAEDGDFGFAFSDNIGMDSDGDMMMRVGDNTTWQWTWTPAKCILCQAGMTMTTIGKHTVNNLADSHATVRFFISAYRILTIWS